MHYEKLTSLEPAQAARETVLSICPTGVLETTVSIPSELSDQRPLLAIHGISRNAHELTAAFASAAEATGRIVVIPHFAAEKWPIYQRITRRARPDTSLLSLLATLRAMDKVFEGPIDLFGYSGGAQLAHRFAMLYPETAGDLHLGAAGWYTFPDADVAYPYGCADADEKSARWSRRMRCALPHFLQRRITVYAGSKDIERDAALRTNPMVDRLQGTHRMERAERYVNALNEQQLRLGLSATSRLNVLADCDHSFSACAERGSLALLVCQKN